MVGPTPARCFSHLAAQALDVRTDFSCYRNHLSLIRNFYNLCHYLSLHHRSSQRFSFAWRYCLRPRRSLFLIPHLSASHIPRMRGIAKNYTDLEKYFALLTQDVSVKDTKRPQKITQVKGGIEFRNVTFLYPETQTPVLENFDIDVKPGQPIALVGRSGQGKSTIVKLLMRFYDLYAGQILLDCVDITKFRKSDLRARIGVVPQEPILFNNTIEYNIYYGQLSRHFRKSRLPPKWPILMNLLNHCRRSIKLMSASVALSCPEGKNNVSRSPE